MAMRKAFTGGACAPGGDGQAMGNNAMTNMMDFMISGGANASQKAEGYGPQMNSSHMAEMEAAYADQHKLEAMNRQFNGMNMNPQMMAQAPMTIAEVSKPNIEAMNGLWDKPMEK